MKSNQTFMVISLIQAKELTVVMTLTTFSRSACGAIRLAGGGHLFSLKILVLADISGTA